MAEGYGTPTTTSAGDRPAGTAEAKTPNPGNPDLVRSLNTIRLSPDEVHEWWERIEQSEQRMKDREAMWDTLLKSYEPTVNDYGQPEDVKANAHHRNTHTKIGQTFVKSPVILMSPRGPALDQVAVTDPATGMTKLITNDEVVPIRQAVINLYMGPDFIDGLALMEECQMDWFTWAGIAAVEVSYTATVRKTPRPVMQPDPNWQPTPQPGSMLGMAPQIPPQVPVLETDPTTGETKPKVELVDTIVHEEVNADHLSPKKLLLDELLNSPRYARFSRWIGVRFFISKRVAQRKYGLSDADVDYTGASDDRVYQSRQQTAQADSKDLIGGYKLWYKAAHFRDDEDHPEAINQLVLLDCHKSHGTTAVSRPTPDQTFDDKHQLTPDSILGFPIKVGSLRVMPDSPYPYSDAAFVNALAKQLDTHLQQGVRLRDAAIGMYFYDTDAIDDTDVAKMKNPQAGAFIGMKAGTGLQGWDKIFYTTAQVKRSEDDYRSAREIQQRMDETLGISPVESGAGFDTVRSATEVTRTSAGAQGRMGHEQGRACAFYLEIVRAVDAYIFRYFTGTRYVEVVGQDGARRVEMWNKKLGRGVYAYDLKMDSQLQQTDMARDRQQKLAGYTSLAPDPLFNRAPVIRDIARDFGWDPSRVVHSAEDLAMQQQAQAMGVPSPTPPYQGSGPGAAHMQERSGRTENARGPSGPGDNRQDRRPSQQTSGE